MATLRRLPSEPVIIKPSAAEIANGKLDSRNLEIAVRQIHQDGLVVVENAIPHEYIDHLNKKMVQDARILQNMKENSPFNFNRGNLQQDAPPIAEFFKKDIFINPLVTQITSCILGPQPQWRFCSGNTAVSVPDETPQRQPVHSDADFNHPDHPFALVVNVPLITMTPENGSTEIWLGTQNFDHSAQEGAHGDRASGRIQESLLEKRRAQRPPSQPVVKKGSIVIRDLRLWHAGMPNKTEDVRVMLAMIHFAPWYRNGMMMEFGEDVKPIVEKETEGLVSAITWIDTEEARKSYLNRGFGNSYDFDQVA